MDQDYHTYSDADHMMWKQLFERQMQVLPGIASKTYLEGVDKVGFVAGHIPNFKTETNPKLQSVTNWKVYVVPGLIPHKEFYTHLSNREFPASTWLRKPEQIEYLEEPDMFHDTFGHVPLLSNQAFCDFIERLSHVALKFIDHENVLAQISRLYWYTVEFGLIRESGLLKIYGGGIISSAGESAYCLSKKIPKLDFDVTTLLATPYHIDSYQHHYFVIDSYDQLYESVEEIEKKLDEVLETR